MNLREIEIWVKDGLAKNNRALIEDGVKETNTNKVHNHLKSIQQLIVNLYDEESIDEVTLQEISVSDEGQLLKFRISIPKQVKKIE